MTQCNNCASPITCGCQVRVASNGSRVCSSCIASYEQKLNEKKVLEQTNTYHPDENSPA